MVGLRTWLGVFAGLSVVKATVTLPDWVSVDAYILTQTLKSQAGITANIGPDGSKAHGANSGVVIASPSTVNPDYL